MISICPLLTLAKYFAAPLHSAWVQGAGTDFLLELLRNEFKHGVPLSDQDCEYTHNIS